MPYNLYDQLIQESVSWFPAYEYYNNDRTDGIHMITHHHPVSVKYVEFESIQKIVLNNKLTKGIEIATGFGISGLAAALAMRQLGGKLVTIDSYIEEAYGMSGAYGPEERKDPKTTDGYKSVQNLVKHFQLEDTFIPEIGWSPENVGSIYAKHFAEDKLDYAFIDALHTNEAVMKDLTAIAPLMDTKHCIFLHDSMVFSQEVKDLCKRLFGRSWEVVPGCEFPNGYGLALINNMGTN